MNASFLGYTRLHLTTLIYWEYASVEFLHLHREHLSLHYQKGQSQLYQLTGSLHLCCFSMGNTMHSMDSINNQWLFTLKLALVSLLIFVFRNRARWSERDTTTVVTNCLQFLLLNETLWPESRRPLSVTARWCRLALVFLAGILITLHS